MNEKTHRFLALFLCICMLITNFANTPLTFGLDEVVNTNNTFFVTNDNGYIELLSDDKVIEKVHYNKENPAQRNSYENITSMTIYPLLDITRIIDCDENGNIQNIQDFLKGESFEGDSFNYKVDDNKYHDYSVLFLTMEQYLEMYDVSATADKSSALSSAEVGDTIKMTWKSKNLSTTGGGGFKGVKFSFSDSGFEDFDPVFTTYDDNPGKQKSPDGIYMETWTYGYCACHWHECGINNHNALAPPNGTEGTATLTVKKVSGTKVTFTYKWVPEGTMHQYNQSQIIKGSGYYTIPYQPPETDSLTKSTDWSFSDKITVEVYKKNVLGNPLQGFKFKIQQDSNTAVTVTTDANGKASHVFTVTGSGTAKSGTYKYVTNWSDISAADRTRLQNEGYYKNKTAAAKAAQADADSKAATAKANAKAKTHTYKVTESAVSGNYILVTTPQSQTASGTKTLTYNFTNAQNPVVKEVTKTANWSFSNKVTIKIKKFDKEGNLLPNFEFKIAQDGKEITSVKTNANGEASYAITVSGSGTATSSTFKYITNYDYLSDADKKTYASYYKTEAAAAEAAQADANSKAATAKSNAQAVAHKYTVTEVKTPDNNIWNIDTAVQEQSTNKTITLTFDFTNTQKPQSGTVSATKEFTANYPITVKVIKKDKATGELLAGFTFDVYKDNTKIGTITTNNNGEASFVANNTVTKTDTVTKKYILNYEKLSDADKKIYSTDNGYYRTKEAAQKAADTEALANAKLAAETESSKERTYKVIETNVKAPYILDGTPLSQKASGTKTITFNHTNEPARGTITIIKKGDALTSISNGIGNLYKEFNYSEQRYAGATFELYAIENIYKTPTKIAYKAGNLIGTFTTKADGTVDIPDLYMGKYKIVEIKAPHGLTLAKNVADRTHEVELVYAGQTQKIVTTSTSYTNKKASIALEIEKLSSNDKSSLANAEFVLYAAEDIKDYYGNVVITKGTAIEKVITDANGKVKFNSKLPFDYKFEIKEVKAPTNYIKTNDVYSFSTTYKNDLTYSYSYSHTFENTPQMGKLEIIKKGPVLTSVSNGSGNVYKVFNYTEGFLPNAVYKVYANQDIYQSQKNIIYKANDLIGTYTTGADGKIKTEDLYIGQYRVVEIKAPEGYTLPADEAARTHIVNLEYKGQDATTTFASTTYKNDRPTSIKTVTKKSLNDDSTLQGAEFTLYAAEDIKDVNGNVVLTKDTAIEKVITNYDGVATFKSDIPINFSYYVKETLAPVNYYKNDDTFTIDHDYKNDTTYSYTYEYTFKNKEVRGTITLDKDDKELFHNSNPYAIDKNGTQGDATLKDATYTLYAAENIMHPNNKGQIIYKANEIVAEMNTDIDGKLVFENLYLGKYYVKETNPSTGYIIDSQIYNVNIPYEGENVEIVKGKVDPFHIELETLTSLEQIKKQAFKFIKVSTDGAAEETELIKGAEFTVKLASDVAKLGWDDAPAYDVFTSAEDGTAQSIELPYGTYIVKETKTPENLITIDDFVVVISEDSRVPQDWRALNDAPFKAYVKLHKKDAETGKVVLLPNTTFKIKNLETNEYVTQKIGKDYISTFTTDETGTVQTPLLVKYGRYQVEEIKAPNGYILSNEPVEFTIGTNSAYRVDQDGDPVVDVYLENISVKGQITVTKQGEVLVGVDKSIKNNFTSSTFNYEIRKLKDAQYQIIAAENIYSADNQQDIIYTKDQVIETITTGEDGTATSSILPLGKYIVKEIKAPNGFAIAETPEKEVTLKYKDQVTSLVFDSSSVYTNERQKISLSISKTDNEFEMFLPDAIFELYAKENIYNVDGELIVAKDEVIETQVTDINGKIVFKADIPLGNYYLREIKAPNGYATIKTNINIDATYKGQEIELVAIKSDIGNVMTWVEFDKVDEQSDVSLSGAELQLLMADSNGDVIEGVYVDEWTSVANEPHVVRGLLINTTYVVREKQAPYGYVKADDMLFDVEDTEMHQEQLFGNKQVKGKISISKTGEQLTNVIFDENGKATFIYEEKPLEGVVFKLYAAENIINLDGETEDWFMQDALVAELTTDKNGIAVTEELPLGKYYIKEISTIDGFVLDTERHDIEIEYAGQLVETVITPANLINLKQDVSIKLNKVDVETKAPVPQTEFSLFNSNDILDYQGKVLIKANTLLSVALSNNEGDVDFEIDLPLGKYYIIETKSAPGYTTNGTIGDRYEIDATYQGEGEHIIELPALSQNQKTKHIFGKVDIDTNVRLNGAMLSVLKIEKDENGKFLKDENGDYITTVIDSWTSDKNETFESGGVIYFGHGIEGKLIVGETYIFREVLAPNGYVGYNASSDTTKEANKDENTIKQEVIFTVQNDKSVVSHTIKDQSVVGNIIVNKTGEVLVDYKEPNFLEKAGAFITRIFEYITGSIKDAEFEIYAAEDIMHPDGETGVIYKQGTLIETIKTDYLGTAKSSDLPLGSYTVKEVVASDGYVLNTEEKTITLEYIDQDTPVVTGETGYVNERQKVSITIVKKTSAESENKYLNTTDELLPEDVNLKGAIFGLYTKEPIYANKVNEDGSVVKTDIVLLEQDELIETATSDENGVAMFTSDLPLGTYYVKELTAPIGYHTSDEIVEIDCTYKGQDTALIEVSADFYNIPVTVAIDKVAIDTNEPLKDAILTVVDSEGNTFDTWITDGTTHYVKHLEIGKTYKLVELTPANGYVTAEPIEFTVNDLDEDGKVIELQTIEAMVDDVTKLEISKNDITTSKEIVGAHMQIIDEFGNVVEEWISEETPHYVEKLPIGKYTLVETQAPTEQGYVKAENVEFEILDTPEIQKVEMKDDYTKLEISKVDITTGAPVEGATLSIIPLDEEGNPKEGETFATWVTDEENYYIEYIPVGDYILREQVAPFDDGYITAEDVKFTVLETGEIQKVEMKDDYTKLEISKTDITTGAPVVGATLSIIPLDEEGNPKEGETFATWITDENNHYINYIPVGDYILREEVAPFDDGYVTAEDVKFTVLETGEIQKVEMKDDYTKLEISKVDITNKEELPGATLQIIDKDGNVVEEWVSTDKPHYIEYIPVGEYTLKEITTPDGYVTAEDVKFEITDTGEIQKVEMVDDITKLEISKVDITNKEELPGATLQIIDKDGNVVEEWVSTDKPHYIEKLPVGEYTLKEITTPNGYVTAEDVKFEVKDTGEIQKVTMVDDITKLEISKVDITNNKELPGAKLQILDKDGKVIEEWISTDKPHYIEKLPVGEYTLREITAPNGYQIAEDVKFEVKDTGEIQKVTMADKPIPKDITPTGDFTNTISYSFTPL